MGILSGIFSHRPGIETELESRYGQIIKELTGFPEREAKQMCRDFISKAKGEMRSANIPEFPDYYGDLLLKNEPIVPEMKETLAKSRAEGATDNDIKWWWNLHELERSLIRRIDDMRTYALFRKAREDGFSQEQAEDIVRKTIPVYGNPQDTPSTGDNRPLPDELRNRVNIYLSKTDFRSFLQVDELSSINALIRREMRNGKV